MLSSSFLRFVAVEHRRLAFFDDMLGPAHRGGRVLLDHLADDQPIEQHADRGQVLLDGRRLIAARQDLDIGRDVVGADRAELADVVLVEPGEEAAHGDGIGRARVRVADVGGEEVDEPQRGALAGGGDHRRHQHRAGCRFEDGDLGLFPNPSSGVSDSAIVTPLPRVRILYHKGRYGSLWIGEGACFPSLGHDLRNLRVLRN